MQLSDRVAILKGVGKEIERKLNKLNVATLEDLIHYYPRRYEDFSNLTKIGKLKLGPATVAGEITQAITRRTSRRGFAITEALIEDDSGAVKAIWFNQPYLATGLPKYVPVFV